MKNKLRKEFLQKRDAIENRSERSKRACDYLTSLAEYKNSESVLCYASFGSEVETFELMKQMLEEGKQVCLPKCDVKTKTMKAVEVTDLSTLQKGPFGIYEPCGDEAVNPREFDLIVIPLVAFDRNLSRLGYGSGYYDRYLPNTMALCVAFAFDEQFTEERIPITDEDYLMDMVVTDKEVIYNAF